MIWQKNNSETTDEESNKFIDESEAEANRFLGATLRRDAIEKMLRDMREEVKQKDKDADEAEYDEDQAEDKTGLDM